MTKKAQPTGVDLDRDLRKILLAANRSNVLTSAAAIQRLMKCSGVQALRIVSDIILAKEKR